MFKTVLKNQKKLRNQKKLGMDLNSVFQIEPKIESQIEV